MSQERELWEGKDLGIEGKIQAPRRSQAAGLQTVFVPQICLVFLK